MTVAGLMGNRKEGHGIVVRGSGLFLPAAWNTAGCRALLPNSHNVPILTCRQHNDIVVSMIPDLVNVGGPWKVLPPGIHDATLEEVAQVFGNTVRRRQLFKGLLAGCQALEAAGCTVVIIDGSYITDKPEPGDFDVCWEPAGVQDGKLDPVLLDFADRRRRQKERYGGEFFPSTAKADGTRNFTDYFQTDKDGRKRGIIRVRLSVAEGG